MKKKLLNTTLISTFATSLLTAGCKKSRRIISYGFRMYRRPRVSVISPAKYARQRLIELKKVG